MAKIQKISKNITSFVNIFFCFVAGAPRNDGVIQLNEAVLKACHGWLDPPSPRKSNTDYQGIAGLRYATPAMT